jgi:hypothetical protein
MQQWLRERASVLPWHCLFCMSPSHPPILPASHPSMLPHTLTHEWYGKRIRFRETSGTQLGQKLRTKSRRIQPTSTANLLISEVTTCCAMQVVWTWYFYYSRDYCTSIGPAGQFRCRSDLVNVNCYADLSRLETESTHCVLLLPLLLLLHYLCLSRPGERYPYCDGTECLCD